jgi:hypothetical protein
MQAVAEDYNMSLDPCKQQIHVEAKRLLAYCQPLSSQGLVRSVENYRVQSYSSQAYRPKPWLRRTTTPAQYANLTAILEDLRALNEEHVGEPIIEVNVYFALTGVHESLDNRLFEWTKLFLVDRLKKANPKDKDDELWKFTRLYNEYLEVFGGRSRDFSVDFLCLATSTQYAAKYLFYNTGGKVLNRIECGSGSEADKFVTSMFAEFGFGRDGLEWFIEQATVDGISDRLAKISKSSSAQLRQYVNHMMDNLSQMRPFLVRDFNPAKTRLAISPSLWCVVNWCALEQGVMSLSIERTERAAMEAVKSRTNLVQVVLSRSGLLFDLYQPWLSVEHIKSRAEVSSLAINAYVLELIEKKLFDFYDQIDQSKIRQSAAAESVSKEAEAELVAWSLQELAASEAEEDQIETELITDEREELRQHPGRRPIRHLRVAKFLRVLERHFGCEVHSGKGDETVIFRQGGRHFRIGRPGQIHQPIVTRALRHLNIPLSEWLQVVDS